MKDFDWINECVPLVGRKFTHEDSPHLIYEIVAEQDDQVRDNPPGARWPSHYTSKGYQDLHCPSQSSRSRI